MSVLPLPVSEASPLLRSADAILAGARDLHVVAGEEGPVPGDVREASAAVNHALGELAAAMDTLERRLVAAPTASAELERRSREFVSALMYARRSGELVCRHLPRLVRTP
jgi:hypothetical protein